MKNKILLHQVLDYTSKLSPGMDTCWADRLINWQFFYHMSQIFNCSLVVQNYYWPETLFLDLPNTENVDIFETSIDKVDALDVRTFSNILSDLIQSIQWIGKNTCILADAVGCKPSTDTPHMSHELLKNFINEHNSIFKNNNSRYCVYDSISLRNQFYHDIEKLFSIPPIIFKEIKFKKEKVNKFFIKNFSDLHAIQIRRGSGAKTNKKYLDDLFEYVDPTYVKLYYDNALLINKTPLYEIKTDDFYFKVIDDHIKNDPNRKIYLSYDVPKKFIQHYLDKYPKNIVTRDDYLEEYLSYFEEFDLENKQNTNYFLPLKKILIILLDFFALAHSYSILSYKKEKERFQSGWVYFSMYYREKEIIYR